MADEKKKVVEDPHPSEVLPRTDDDGRVRVGKTISDEAVAQGFEPDIQPKAHPGTPAPVGGVADSALAQVLPAPVIADSTQGELQRLVQNGDTKAAEEAAKLAVAKQVALEQLTAPLSTKVENAVRGEDAASIAKEVSPS